MLFFRVNGLAYNFEDYQVDIQSTSFWGAKIVLSFKCGCNENKLCTLAPCTEESIVRPRMSESVITKPIILEHSSFGFFLVSSADVDLETAVTAQDLAEVLVTSCLLKAGYEVCFNRIVSMVVLNTGACILTKFWRNIPIKKDLIFIL